MRMIAKLLLIFFLTLPAVLISGGIADAVFPVTLDSQSIECLSCHDAALAVDTTITTICGQPECDHPIGIDYAFLSMGNAALKPVSSLQPSIVLISNNMIGCGTCHVPYSAADHSTLTTLRRLYKTTIPDPMLVMDNSQSKLCLECHMK